jgi:acetolactate synthase I/II/III large subunit
LTVDAEPRDGSRSTVSEAILNAWRRHHVEVVFTVPGGPLMPFLRACHGSCYPRVVTCRHETAACIMAATYFHERGLAGVALTSGPGAANAVNGIIHALREQAGVFIISARPVSNKFGRGAVQDFDTARLLHGITKRSEQLIHPAQASFLPEHLACLAGAPSAGPVNLTVAADQWDMPCGGEA